MNKEVELFDRKFVYVLWEDSLEGKECFVADEIGDLLENVDENKNCTFLKMAMSCAGEYPFAEDEESDEVMCWRFAYYDPNYEVKRAYYKEGKKIQYRVKGFEEWEDYINQNPCWDDEDREWRIKPEVEWCVCETIDLGLQIMELEDEIESAVLFKGTSEECYKWIVEHEKKCPCEEGVDSKVCKDCQQYEERKRKRIEERASKFGEVCVHPEYDDEECKKCNECIEGADYRPFKDCDELVEFWSQHYQTGLRPAHTKPLIWVRLKCDGRERLIVAFGTDFVEIGNKAKAVTLQKLFEDYEFLDGSPVGKEC